jgi:hypothetical protein
MTPTDVLDQARAAGVELWATQREKILWRCPGGLPDAIRHSLAAHKHGILGLLPLATQCPLCKRPMDTKRRCWRCCDRLCEECGLLTGSAFIGLCWLCQVARERKGGTPTTPDSRSSGTRMDENA